MQMPWARQSPVAKELVHRPFTSARAVSGRRKVVRGVIVICVIPVCVGESVLKVLLRRVVFSGLGDFLVPGK